MIKIIVESTISPTLPMRRNRRKNPIQTEQLEKFELGKCYPDFHLLEPFIDEWDVDVKNLKVGDIVIRDWQFGHLKNTGYIPLEVVEIFDGVSITVQDERGHRCRMCVEPVLMRDKKLHKLNGQLLSKQD